MVILGCAANSKADSITYTIYFPENYHDSAAVKQEVLDRYRELIRGVHEESEAVLVAHNLSYFMWEKDMQAKWQGGELVIAIGDAKGAVIHGDLRAEETCFPQVKTKSLLWEWFNE